MKNAKSMFIALLPTALIFSASMASQARSAQQTVDQTKTDSNAVKQTKDKQADGAATQKKRSSNKSAVSTASTSPTAAPEDASGGAAPASDQPALGQKASPVSTSRMVWVNTESGVYHKPGTRCYGKTKHGKYMTEADAIKAGYHPAKKE